MGIQTSSPSNLDLDEVKKLRESADNAKHTANKAQEDSTVNRTLIMAVLWIAVGIVITLLVGLGAIFQSYLAAKTATYQNLIDKVTEQNAKIDSMQRLLDELPKQMVQEETP